MAEYTNRRNEKYWARCTVCRHVWLALCPDAGTPLNDLECSECGTQDTDVWPANGPRPDAWTSQDTAYNDTPDDDRDYEGDCYA